MLCLACKRISRRNIYEADRYFLGTNVRQHVCVIEMRQPGAVAVGG